jgi:hypothetical protein
MTFSAIRLPSFTSLPRRTAAQNAAENVDHADMRREYIERLLSSDACISEYGAQALMGLFPKDF